MFVKFSDSKEKECFDVFKVKYVQVRAYGARFFETEYDGWFAEKDVIHGKTLAKNDYIVVQHDGTTQAIKLSKMVEACDALDRDVVKDEDVKMAKELRQSTIKNN